VSRAFLIPSLFAAGLGKVSPEQVTFTALTRDNPDQSPNLFQVYKQNHLFTLAQHRSHSSHSSHRSGYSSGHYSHSSHTSHRSSYGGGYSAPAPSPVYSAPTYDPSPTPAPPTSPSRAQPLYRNGANSSSEATTPTSPTQSLPSLSGRTKKFERIVRLVQIGLLAQGVYEGPLNGSVGPLTRSALRKFQEKHGLTATGTITPETLDALRVPSE
jgi:His-Xaa-Ser repeat protein HxsA